MLRLSSVRLHPDGDEASFIGTWGISPTLVWEMAHTDEDRHSIGFPGQFEDRPNTHLYNYIQTGVVNLNSPVATASPVHYLRMEAV